MNEEIHESFNMPLCISSQNGTAYYIKLGKNRRRFTVSGVGEVEGFCVRRPTWSSDRQKNSSPFGLLLGWKEQPQPGSVWHFSPTPSHLILGRFTEQRNGIRDAVALHLVLSRDRYYSEAGVEMKITSAHDDKFLSKALGW